MKYPAKGCLGIAILFVLYSVGCGVRFPTKQIVTMIPLDKMEDHTCESALVLWSQKAMLSHPSSLDPPTGLQITLRTLDEERITVENAKGKYRYNGGSWKPLVLTGSEWYGRITAHKDIHHVWFIPQESERLEAMKHTVFRPLKTGNYEFYFTYRCNGSDYRMNVQATYGTKRYFVFLMPWDYIPNQWGG